MGDIEQLANLAENLDKIKTAIAVNKAEEKRLLTELESNFNISSIDEALLRSDKIEPEIMKLVEKRDKLVKSANTLIEPLLEGLNGLLEGTS